MHDITDYIPEPEDSLIKNPYLTHILALVKQIKKEQSENYELELLKFREEYICEYAFSIPTASVLKKISEFSPIIELGAGSGYWAWCLDQTGADIYAIDNRPPGNKNPYLWYEDNRWFNDMWYNIEEGTEQDLTFHSNRALLLSWPEINDPMAYNALRIYREAGGKHLIYIGDPGSSGDQKFHDELAALKEIERIWLPGWPGIDDFLFIYKI